MKVVWHAINWWGVRMKNRLSSQWQAQARNPERKKRTSSVGHDATLRANGPIEAARGRAQGLLRVSGPRIPSSGMADKTHRLGLDTLQCEIRRVDPVQEIEESRVPRVRR